MKTKIFLLFVIILSGCKRMMQTDCGILRCPSVRNAIYLSVVDANGEPTKASYIETYNTRTEKKEINLQDPPRYNGGANYKYKLFVNPRDFSFGGDFVHVVVKSESGKEFKLDYIIKGGNCTCDVEKVRGADLVVID